MGRQWLLAKREVSSLRKSQASGKLLREITVASKHGGPDPAGNARLFAAVEKARKESVPRDAIERAINKGAGIGTEKMILEHIAFDGYAPHKVPVIVEVLTDNNNRTAPEIRVLFKKGQLDTSMCSLEPCAYYNTHISQEHNESFIIIQCKPPGMERSARQ